MNFFHVGSSAHPKIMKNHSTSSKNHKISSKKHRKIINLDRKLRTPKYEILTRIDRKSECESERQKSDPNGPKIIDFELLFGRNTTGVLIFQYRNSMQKTWKLIQNCRQIMKFHQKIITKSLILIENYVPQNARYSCVFTAKASAKASEMDFR